MLERMMSRYTLSRGDIGNSHNETFIVVKDINDGRFGQIWFLLHGEFVFVLYFISSSVSWRLSNTLTPVAHCPTEDY